MKNLKHSASFYTVVILTALILYLLDTTGIMTLQIGAAHPILLIPLLVAVSINTREWPGIIIGALFGAMLDITGANSCFFNFAVMLVIGCATGLLVTRLVNDNIYAALALSLGANLFYYIAKWLIFFVSMQKADVLNYLISYCIPSAAYNTIFVIPFYYYIRFVARKTHYIGI